MRIELTGLLEDATLYMMNFFGEPDLHKRRKMIEYNAQFAAADLSDKLSPNSETTCRVDTSRMHDVPGGIYACLPVRPLVYPDSGDAPCGYLEFNIAKKKTTLRLYGDSQFRTPGILVQNTGITYKNNKLVLGEKHFVAMPIVPGQGEFLFGLYLVDLLTNKWYLLCLSGNDYDVIIKSVSILKKYSSCICNAHYTGNTLNINLGDFIFDILKFNNFNLTSSSFELLDGVTRMDVKATSISDVEYWVDLPESVVQLPDFGYSTALRIKPRTGSKSLHFGKMPVNSEVQIAGSPSDEVRSVFVTPDTILSRFQFKGTTSRLNLHYASNLSFEQSNLEIKLSSLVDSDINVSASSTLFDLNDLSASRVNISGYQGGICFVGLKSSEVNIRDICNLVALDTINDSTVVMQSEIKALRLRNSGNSKVQVVGNVAKLDCTSGCPPLGVPTKVLVSGNVGLLQCANNTGFVRGISMHVVGSIEKMVASLSDSQIVCDSAIESLYLTGKQASIIARGGIRRIYLSTRPKLSTARKDVTPLTSSPVETLTCQTLSLLTYLDDIPAYFRDVFSLVLAPLGIMCDDNTRRCFVRSRARNGDVPVKIYYTAKPDGIYSLDITCDGTLTSRGAPSKYAQGNYGNISRLVEIDFKANTSGAVFLDIGLPAFEKISSRANWIISVVALFEHIKITVNPGTKLFIRFRADYDIPGAINAQTMRDTVIRDYSAFITAALGEKGCNVPAGCLKVVTDMFMNSVALNNVTAICIPRARGTKEIFGK